MSWTSVADMPTARFALAAARLNLGPACDRIYAFGGSGVLNTVESYDTATNVWATEAPMPTARFGLAAVAVEEVGHGWIYTIGGRNAPPPAPPLSTVETLFRYFRAHPPRCGPDIWSTQDPAHDMPLQHPRDGLAAVAFQFENQGDFLIAIGGSDGTRSLRTVEIWDLQSSLGWAAVEPIHTPRTGLAAVAGPDGFIYAIGGFDGRQALNTVERYLTGFNVWKPVAPMLTPRSDLAAVLGPDGRIYAIGGSHQQALNSVEAYDVHTNTWSPVAPMSVARSGLAAAVGADGRIYAMGGVNNFGPQKVVEAFRV